VAGFVLDTTSGVHVHPGKHFFSESGNTIYYTAAFYLQYESMFLLHFVAGFVLDDASGHFV